METKKRKSLDDLRLQWAGGRDAWLRVPLTSTPLKHNEPNVIPFLLTRVKHGGGDPSCRKQFENSSVAAAAAESESAWPPIVQESVLFGISACNPRGQEAPLETNQKQHRLLYKDIQRIVAKHGPCPTTAGPAITFWDAVGIWEDGSYEPGFILAFPRKMENQGLAWSMTLARNYNQGAIYRFQLDERMRMMRDTIAVLEEQGCEARVQVEIDNTTSAGDMDLSKFVPSAAPP